LGKIQEEKLLLGPGVKFESAGEGRKQKYHVHVDENSSQRHG